MWYCPKCNAKLIGNNNGYIITGSRKDYTHIQCQKCKANLEVKLMGKSMFFHINHNQREDTHTGMGHKEMTDDKEELKKFEDRLREIITAPDEPESTRWW